MENLKIKATDEDSAIESRVLFRILGFSPDNSEYEQYVNWVAVFEDGSGSFFEADTNLEECREITLQELRDMVKPKMKEYLFKYNEQYTLVELSKEDAESNPEQYIEIPEWGNYAYNNDTGVYFLKDAARYSQSSLVWQRESLNDKIATAEVARQEEKHSHYKKDVSHLNVIDPYRISDLYDLHPCADHIMKKSLCAGNRGHKDMLRDIQDIIDTAERWKQMIEEDNSEI